MALPNVYKIEVYYKWGLIQNDLDDNKFVDCSVSSNSDFIVTHDRHFDVLKNIEFPKIEMLKIDEFEKLLFKNKYTR